jgi:predicted NAD-dependent protein-ADP-ribosyltransferase YbiA (DUF1768 family)
MAQQPSRPFNLPGQLHDTRERLYTLRQAVLAQDEAVKAAVLEALSQLKSPQAGADQGAAGA